VSCALLVSLLAVCGGCTTPAPDQASGEHDGGASLQRDVVGRVQKGPFIRGASIRVAELDAELHQTGRSFSAIVSDDSGAFSVPGIELDSQYVRIEADGFYFNEVRGELSDSALALYSYADLSDQSTLNLNVLGHLTAARIERLVMEEQVPFGEAKATAQREVLRAFEIDADIAAAETLDITQAGSDNAVLLAISIMAQGTRRVGELSELLSSLQSDLRDGTLDRESNGEALMNGARTVNMDNVRQALTERYAEIGKDAAVPAFEKHVRHFIEAAPYDFTNQITYPADGKLANVLSLGTTEYLTGTESPEMTAIVPEGVELRVRMTATTSNLWSISITEFHADWEISEFDHGNKSQDFRATKSGRVRLPRLYLEGKGGATIEYFEYGADSATTSKEISWSPRPDEAP